MRTLEVKKKIKVKNKFERRILDQLEGTRLEFSYETEKIPYILSRNYIPDFVIKTKSGKKLYIEAKGYFRPEHKAKMVAVKKLYPDMDIRILFYAPNKKYQKWAEKNNFPYAFGEIPEEWISDAKNV